MTVPVFVYGTLRPGGTAWEVVAHAVAAVETATARGTVFETGRGYPAARFGGAGVVAGAVLWVSPEVLDDLDEYEGVHRGLFRRVEIVAVTAAGEVAASAYEYVPDTSALPERTGPDTRAGSAPGSSADLPSSTP